MRPFFLALPLLFLTACGDNTSSRTTASAPASTGAPTEDDVKTVLTRRAKSLATGVGSSHSHVDVEFQSVEIALGRKLNEQDRIDGIRGDTAWPVRAKWVEHRRWGAEGAGGSTEDVPQHYSYDFYRDAFGGWDFVGHGPVR